MAAELQPPGLGTQLTTLLPGASAAAPQNVPPSSTTEPNPGSTLAPKRHRRPSVRLGDIGDQPATLRTSKPWRLNPNSHPHREHHNPNKSSKIRPLTNLVAPINGNFDYSSAETTTTNNNGIISHRKFPKEFKSKRATRDDVGVNLDIWHAHNRRSIRATRVSNSQQEMGMESNSRNRGSGLEEGVRKWLVELGLGRYAPVFEIHEVDEEVLPYLTLDDLKDMGINAVGSRRKLYSAIQNLRKGLS
uniref:SAM domain-containing protein n=1 Tax=Chenopodium quinoa TaxID=63459 RepID=A0A803L1G0_CHEQI